ncbi:4-amino-4-deoxy-L-arabinose-phosphoundecaprenol flippase subunit ArnE [soil metagenome]
MNQLVAIFLIVCATTIEAGGQLCFKKKSTRSADGDLGSRMWLAGGIACMAVEAVVWTIVLKNMNVSTAYPMGSLSFVMVLLMSRILLKERVQRDRWIGVALILCGTVLLGLNSAGPNS